MPRREMLNNANTAKIMAETFGRYNIFATLSPLSLRRSPTREVTTPFILRAGRPRLVYGFFWYKPREVGLFFLSPSDYGGIDWDDWDE